jgi:small-conductance mechanosensitive channel
MVNGTMPTSRLLLAGGSIMPVLEKLAVSQDELENIGRRLYSAIHPGDVLVLLFLAVCVVPIARVVFGIPVNKTDGYLYQIFSHISQAAKLAILVYIFDCVVVILSSLGFSFKTLTTMSKGFAKILYISWLGFRICVFKRYMLGRIMEKSPDKLGRASTIDRLIDGMIFMGTSFFLMDVLNVDMGVGVTSIFAFGSAGTLVIGLATQNLATMFVNGLVLTTADRITEGDHIKTGNGLSGRVQKIGWFQTVIRHYDEVEEIIPNSELGMQRVSNLSRMKKCQVKQNLRVKYEDIDKLEGLLAAILEEIKAACPQCITDGSRPLRAYFTDFKEDHLRIMVDSHFNLPPMGEVYHKNRHNCMLAIHRAAKKSGVEFVSGIYPNGIN